MMIPYASSVSSLCAATIRAALMRPRGAESRTTIVSSLSPHPVQVPPAPLAVGRIPIRHAASAVSSTG